MIGSDLTTVQQSFLARLRETVRREHLVSAGDILVVGVSGGADSLALLYALHALQSELGVTLQVAHLNHQLRGEASDADAQFVANTAKSLGLPAHIGRADVAELRQRQRLSLEEAARLARYRFFASVIAATNAVGVAVAHTADDQVETVVLHWLRGTGLAGLRGMQPVTTLRVDDEAGIVHAVRVLRPLLDFQHSETEGYCRALGLAPRADVTNADLAFQRNRVRHELLPKFEEFNPRFRETARRTARLLARDYAFIAGEVQRHWIEVAEVRDGAVVLDRARWLALPEALQNHLLREAAARLRGDLNGLGAVHVEAAANALRRWATGKTIQWPRGLVLRIEPTRCVVGTAADLLATPRLAVEPVPLTIPGSTRLPGTDQRIEARIGSGACRWDETTPWHADLDIAKTGSALAVRRRHWGDRFRPLGLGHERKLQDVLVDAHVPRHLRDAVPIVVGREGIVWVAGVRIDDRYKVDEQTQQVLCLRVTPNVGGEDESQV